MNASEYKLSVCIEPLSILQCLSNLSERRLYKYYHFTISALAKSSAKVMCQFQQSSGKIYVSTSAKKSKDTKLETPTHLSSSPQHKINCCNLCTFNLAGINLSMSATTLLWRENCHSTQPGNGWTRELNRFIFFSRFSGSLTPLLWFLSSMKHLTCQIETNRKWVHCWMNNPCEG